MENNRKVNKIRKISLFTRNIIILIITTIVLLISKSFVKATDEIVISKDNWDEWQNEDYWEWHTKTTTGDKAYNGEHIIIQDDVIDFYGYGQASYKDFLFKDYENRGKKIFKFIIDESKANYHTLDGAGFIFNSNIEDEKISGYILLFRQQDICIYRIENVDINEFENTQNTTLANFGELIQSFSKTNNQIHELSVEVSPINLKVEEEGIEILNIDLDYSLHKGESFGLISSYLQHDCPILSTIEFSQFEMILQDYNITILNTDLEENPISGAQFVLKDENGKIIKSGKANGNGIFNAGNLKEGTYTIQQVVKPNGYILNDDIYTFKVTIDGRVLDDENEEVELIIKNEPYVEEEKKEDNKEQNNDQIKDKENKQVDKNVQINNNQKDTSISNTSLPYAGGTITILKITLILSIFASIILSIKLRIRKK